MNAILTLPSINAHNWLKHNSHGVVWKRPDGIMARCMGPARCEQCKQEILIAPLLVELGTISNDELQPEYRLTSYDELERRDG